MKKIFNFIGILFFTVNTTAQNVGIGTTTPHANAALEVKAVNKGLLIPRGDADTRNPALKDNTAKGLMLYDTLSSSLWIHNGNGMPTGWHQVQDDGNGLWIKNGNDISANNMPNGNVAIGLANTTSRVHAVGSAAFTSPVIRSQVSYIGTTDVRAVEGTSLPAPGYGIGGYFEGGLYGLRAIANPQTGTGNAYGLYSTVTNNGLSNNRYGLYSSVNGLGNNYGVYINASAGTNNYALYAADGNAFLSDSLWLNRSPGLARFDMLGTRGDVDVTEGDFRIGNSTQRLKMGIFTTGTFAGLARIYAAGTNARLVLGTNSMDIMGISPLNNGTVVIGNGSGVLAAATGYKLNVQGRIVCTEVMVKDVGSWPDYVFNDTYKLMPLTSLKKYIKTNSHLPNVPSASTIEKSGLHVAEMQKKMMEKIEELTLYILQQDEKIKLQQDEIKSIKKQINK